MDNLQTLPFNMGDDDFSMALKGYQCHGQSIVIDEENGQPCDSQETIKTPSIFLNSHALFYWGSPYVLQFHVLSTIGIIWVYDYIPFQEPPMSQAVSAKEIQDLGPTPEKMMEPDSQPPATPSPIAPAQLEQSPAATGA